MAIFALYSYACILYLKKFKIMKGRKEEEGRGGQHYRKICLMPQRL
jgi:hypothetical protein